MKKVALVLTGLLRCYDRAYPSFKRHFLDKYDCDVYLDIWDEVGYYSGKSYKQSPSDEFVKVAEGDRGFHDSGELVDANAVIALYRPTNLVIEKFSAVEPHFNERALSFVNAYTRPKNSIAQAYKIANAMNTVVNSAIQYDFVVRARPDLVLDAKDFDIDLEPQSTMVFTLPSRNKMNTGTGDSLMIGTPELVNYIASIQYTSLEYIYDRVGVSCPHIFIQEAIRDSKIAQHIEMHLPAHIEHSPAGLYTDPT